MKRSLSAMMTIQFEMKEGGEGVDPNGPNLVVVEHDMGEKYWVNRQAQRSLSTLTARSQVVLKVNNSIFKTNSIIESTVANIIITCFNLKLRN